MHMRVCVINGTSTKVLTDEIETFMGGRRDSFLQLQRQYHAVLVVVGWIYLPNHNKKVAPPTRNRDYLNKTQFSTAKNYSIYLQKAKV